MSAEPAVAMPLTSTERLRTELGFAPQYTLETMLDEYVDRVRSGAVP
jgi:nucleoside-diphosphate-sugar epimerase